jgi:sortase A
VGAVGIGGYWAWQLWGTGIVTSRAQDSLRAELGPLLSERPGRPVQAGEPSDETARLPGHAWGLIRIPKLDLDMAVVEGTDTESLKKGPGHYAGTAEPWDGTGRVGIAGHRTTYGAPFWSLDRLGKGDVVELVTPHGVFAYRVSGTQVILPSESWVLDQTEDPTLVLTTCTPRFSSAQRLAVFADLVT